DDLDGSRAALAAAAQGDGGGAALLRGGEEAVLVDGPEICGPGGAAGILHGDVIRIHGGAAQLHRRAAEDHGTDGGDVVVIQLARGRVVGHQEDLGGHSALAAVGGLVDALGSGAVGQGGRQGGGTAAVQADGGGAAQLQQPLGQQVFGSAHAVAA